MRRVRFVQEDEDSEESTASDYEAEYAIDAGDLGGGKDCDKLVFMIFLCEALIDYCSRRIGRHELASNLISF